MFRAVAIAVLTLGFSWLSPARAADSSPVRYGHNPSAGSSFTHDGVQLYYEVYGQGEPLLVIHGNGGSIHSLGAQIDFFRQHYRVIAMDSRDHGQSGDSAGPMTFEKMADDLAALLDRLHTGPVYVLGWSDGAIEALLLGMRHPEKVRKIAAMSGNLDPGPDALYSEFLSEDDPAPAGAQLSPQQKRARKVSLLDRDEPHIKPEALKAVVAPTLVLASDHDVIRDEHTLVIYHSLPNSQLVIFPDATHMIPYDDPVRFNGTVERFFSTPFVKKDRLKDLFKTIEKMRSQSSGQ